MGSCENEEGALELCTKIAAECGFERLWTTKGEVPHSSAKRKGKKAVWSIGGRIEVDQSP